jgi:steroid delta-isomerase-like uncharacterized protein
VLAIDGGMTISGFDPSNRMEITMTSDVSEIAKAVIRRNTEEVQGGGDWKLFEELFADHFYDHTPQPGGTRDKAGVLALYKRLREAFPDFTPEIHWQRADGDVVTTYKTYHGTHEGDFLGIPGTGKKVSFETVDAMRVVDGKITEHWGVANLYSVMQQLGVIKPLS